MQHDVILFGMEMTADDISIKCLTTKVGQSKCQSVFCAAMNLQSSVTSVVKRFENRRTVRKKIMLFCVACLQSHEIVKLQTRRTLWKACV
jgi:hypothetical protein